jgi:cysteinyl-tRNA synthetase
MHVYNTATKRLEAFVPREAGKVSLYVCGLTPYDAMHLGHARTFLIYDMMRRYLEWRGFQVAHVQNLTDVDDKILARARALRVAPAALAAHYTQEAVATCDALGIRRAHRYPRVTEHIPAILALIQELLARGYAYVTPTGSVYYRVRAFPRYGRLSGRAVETGTAPPARGDAEPDKEWRGDFVLWKAVTDAELSWEAPWGRGRPGWHIECSAMARAYLGPQIDLHGGAIELLFPHHENEIAQTEAVSGVHPAVRYWVHCGVVTLNGRKMAKSAGNVVSVKDGLALAPAPVWRLLFLSSHYRSPLDFRARTGASVGEAVAARLAPARAAWQRIERCVAHPDPASRLAEQAAEVAHPLAKACEATRHRFLAAMDQDFGTPAALTELFALIGHAHAALPALQQGDATTLHAALSAVSRTVRALLGVLGFAFGAPNEGDISAMIEDVAKNDK